MQFFRIARENCEKNNKSLRLNFEALVYTLIYLRMMEHRLDSRAKQFFQRYFAIAPPKKTASTQSTTLSNA